MKKLILFSILLFIVQTSSSQELFEDEKYLETCRAYVPIKYKNIKKDWEVAQLYKNQEMVFFEVDRKTKKLVMRRVFIISEIHEGRKFIYLRNTENLNSPNIFARFTKMEDKYKRFYYADCYDRLIELRSEKEKKQNE
jgi:hypothetical protein